MITSIKSLAEETHLLGCINFIPDEEGIFNSQYSIYIETDVNNF